MSMIFTSINTLTVGDLSQAQSGVGSTVLSIVQQVGIGFGIAVASIILTLYRQFMGNDDALQHAFSYTFLTTSVFAIALVWILSYLRKTDGDHLRKKQ